MVFVHAILLIRPLIRLLIVGSYDDLYVAVVIDGSYHDLYVAVDPAALIRMLICMHAVGSYSGLYICQLLLRLLLIIR